jgi:acyl carrier protein
MTEVGSCVLSNPLARDAAKPGTVGLPVHSGVEVAILDEAGQRLGDGMEGELAVRGPIVMRGYLGEPSGDRADGWFRTGDIAVRDGDGFYAIRGRIKEMINCGGGKIHPSEIDAVAAESPGVAEAASFADPHPTLGETPALAVVPAMADVDLDGLRRHIAGVLGIEKAPRRIVAVEAIPRTVSGKVDRSALARLPRCEGRSEPEPAGSVGATGLEEPIAALWRVVLARPDIPLDRDFFELGGDSLGATQLLLGIEAAYGVRLSSEAFVLDAYTVRRMARAVAAGRGIGPAPVLRERAGPDFVEMDPWRRKGIGRIFHIDPASGLRRARPGSAWGSVAINNLGFRGPDVAADKPDGTVRIAFLGSSTTFDRFSGGNDRTWPDGVVRLLAKAFPAAVLDYVNAGMPGHGTRQIGAMFRHHVAPLAPDLVVIRVNDLNADTAFAARRQGRYSGVHYRPSPLAERWRPWANLEKNLLVLVRVATAALDLGKARLDGAALVGAFAARLRALVEEVAATGATVALVVGGNRLRKGLGPWRRLRAASSQVFYMPHLSLADLVDLREAYERAVAEVATESGAILVDVADAIPADSRHFVDSNHFTAAGSARMAQVVSAKLIDAPAVRERVVGAGRRQSPARTA